MLLTGAYYRFRTTQISKTKNKVVKTKLFSKWFVIRCISVFHLLASVNRLPNLEALLKRS